MGAGGGHGDCSEAPTAPGHWRPILDKVMGRAALHEKQLRRGEGVRRVGKRTRKDLSKKRGLHLPKPRRKTELGRENWTKAGAGWRE